MRFALVCNAHTEHAAKAYLPGNYEVVGEFNGVFLIKGEDNAGWTMDDYVIPRYSSGLIQCYEIPYGVGLALTKDR
jgi:hypothetical protein